MRASDPLSFAPLRGVRVIAQPHAIDAVAWPSAAIVIRIAPDDVVVVDATIDDAMDIVAHDSHAIVEDEPMFLGAWLDAAQFDSFVQRLEWALPATRPAVAQGMVAGLSIKLWLPADDGARATKLLIVSASVMHEVPDRFGAATSQQATA